MARILVVDDSPTEIAQFRKILEKHGHEVIEADNGSDGVIVAREKGPDLVLMDVVMPGLNGFQATRQLSKSPETSHIPVIIVTAKDQETDRVWGSRQGAKGYLVKPVDENVLLDSINSLLASKAN